MNCTDVRENLSAYIDGRLDRQLKDMMDSHLSTCRGCREEFQSMKALAQELGKTGEIKAPEDFLDDFHERLRKESFWTRIREVLFVPAPIKIPLEFATISIAAVLIFSVYSVYSPRDEVPVLRPNIAMQQGTADEVIIRESESQELPQKAKNDHEYVQAAKQQPMELTLIVPHQARPAGGGTPGQKEQVSAGKTAPAARPGSALPAGSKAFTAGRKDNDAGEMTVEHTAGSPEEKKEKAVQQDTVSYGYPEITQKLHELIGLSGGRILSEEIDPKEDRKDRNILAEIPAGQYQGFVKSVVNLARVKEKLPEISHGRKSPVLIRIRLVPEK